MLDQSALPPLPKTRSRVQTSVRADGTPASRWLKWFLFPREDVYHPFCRFYARIYQSSQSHLGPYKGSNEPFLPYCRRQSRNDFVPEGDLYRLVAHSRLPSVERFERRGFGDVLPSIRKTGMYALLAIYVDKVAKLIEQTGMKNTPSVLSDSAQRRTSPVQWQRKHSNAEIMNSGLDGRQKDQSYICRRQSPNRIPCRSQPCGSLPLVEATVFFSIPQN